MTNRLLIDQAEHETRVALIEGDRVVDVVIERQAHRSAVGNIYLGKVSRVLPGMQAAFVGVGLGRNAFLHADDARVLPRARAAAERLSREAAHCRQLVQQRRFRCRLGRRRQRQEQGRERYHLTAAEATAWPGHN